MPLAADRSNAGEVIASLNAYSRSFQPPPRMKRASPSAFSVQSNDGSRLFFHDREADAGRLLWSMPAAGGQAAPLVRQALRRYGRLHS